MNLSDEAVREEPDFLKLPTTDTPGGPQPEVKKRVPPMGVMKKPQKRNQRLAFKCTMDERKSIIDAARKQREMSVGEYLISLHRIFQEVNPAPEDFGN